MTRTRAIAIVDDDEGVRSSLASLLRSLGYAVRSYASAAAFLDDAPAGDPDCLITDVQMPAMNGDQLQAELVASGRSFPIIFMTAFPNEAVRARVLAAGARAVLEKPAGSDVIVACLDAIFRS